MFALFLLWYLYVCLQSSNTVAWFYLFLHTVLRYFLSSTHVPVYFLHPFKLCFFIAKCIHCQCTIYISVYLLVADLQKPHENFKKL